MVTLNQFIASLDNASLGSADPRGNNPSLVQKQMDYNRKVAEWVFNKVGNPDSIEEDMAWNLAVEFAGE